MASPFKKVLCAADFDENCAATIRAARGLLGQDGHLYVFHAVTFPFALTSKEAEVPLSKAKERLADIAFPTAGRTNLELIVESSDNVAKSVLDMARSVSADCIVLSTHGRRGVDRLLLGSVAEQVIHGSEIPVLTVRPRSTGTCEDAP